MPVMNHEDIKERRIKAGKYFGSDVDIMGAWGQFNPFRKGRTSGTFCYLPKPFEHWQQVILS